jgi:hypothetical protein
MIIIPSNFIKIGEKFTHTNSQTTSLKPVYPSMLAYNNI